MTTEAQLTKLVADRATVIVSKASVTFSRDVRKVAPRDTGALGLGFRLGAVSRSGSLVHTEFTSEAKNRGFDYGEYIDKVAKVMPTRRKFLRWFGPSGEVFSRGFVNPNRGWWKTSVTLARWKSAVSGVR